MSGLVNTAAWVTVGLLTPFWWGMGLLLLSVLGDRVQPLRDRIVVFFSRLESYAGDQMSRF